MTYMHPIRYQRIFAACPETSAAAAAWANHNIRIVGFDHTEETLSISERAVLWLRESEIYDMGAGSKGTLNRQSDQTESERLKWI